MGNISQEITNGKFGPMKLFNNHTSSKIKCEDQSAKTIVTCWLHYVYNRAKFGKKNAYFIISNAYLYSLILGLKCIWKDTKIIPRTDIESFVFF